MVIGQGSGPSYGRGQVRYLGLGSGRTRQPQAAFGVFPRRWEIVVVHGADREIAQRKEHHFGVFEPAAKLESLLSRSGRPVWLSFWVIASAPLTASARAPGSFSFKAV